MNFRHYYLTQPKTKYTIVSGETIKFQYKIRQNY